MILDLLAEAVKAARAAGADDVEVSHFGERAGVTRFAHSACTQAGVVEDRITRVRVALGGAGGARVASAITSALDPEGLAGAAEEALALARHRPEDELFAGFARPAEIAPAAGFV